MRVDNVSYNNIGLMPYQKYFSYIVARKVTTQSTTEKEQTIIKYFNIETHSINIYYTHSQCCLVVNMLICHMQDVYYFFLSTHFFKIITHCIIIPVQ